MHKSKFYIGKPYFYMLAILAIIICAYSAHASIYDNITLHWRWENTTIDEASGIALDENDD
jgi:hypothetical protein